MTHEEIIKSTASYFASEQWKHFMEILQKKDEPVYHIHIYVDTCLNPWCLLQVLKNYFAKIGHPIERKVEIFTSGQIAGSGTIHGVEPKGMTHFDMLFRYCDDAAIKPTPNRAENVEYWGEKYMTWFMGQYDFKTELTPEQEQEVEAYFQSDAWKAYCDLNESDKVVHIHANVETSVHPLVIRKYALKAMEKRGWEIEFSAPVAFAMRGLMHGKIVFGGKKPEKMFDIAWGYNPTVTLVPSTKYWLTTESPWYDARTMNEIPVMLQKYDWQLLSLAEMEEIAALV